MPEIPAPKISTEMLERLYADTTNSEKLLSEHTEKISELRHLADGIKEAVEINKTLSRRLERRRRWPWKK